MVVAGVEEITLDKPLYFTFNFEFIIEEYEYLNKANFFDNEQVL